MDNAPNCNITLVMEKEEKPQPKTKKIIKKIIKKKDEVKVEEK